MRAESRQKGQALLSVVGLLLVLTFVAWAFVSLMNVEQRLAGGAYRAAAALYLAEAGVEKALWYLANGAPAGSRGGTWRPEGHQEELGSGRFVIEEIKEQLPGLVAITVHGEVGGSVRRVRRTVRVVPKALGFSLIGDELVFADGARTYIVPFLQSQKGCQRIGDIAATREMAFEKETVLNTLAGNKVLLLDAVVLDYELFGLASSPKGDAEIPEVLPDLVLHPDAQLLLGEVQRPSRDLAALRREVRGARTLRHEKVSMPEVDLEIYRAKARGNRANQAINEAAGGRALDRVLSEKEDSLYTGEQFKRILHYLDVKQADRREESKIRLSGIVFVEGGVSVARGFLLEDGALIVKGSVEVADHGRLEVRHGLSTKSLPGIIAFGDGGTIRLGREAVAIVDGLVLSSTGVEVYKARLSIAGALLTGQGFLNDSGLVVVRYQPDVLRTIGLRRTDHVLVRPVSWQELPIVKH